MTDSELKNAVFSAISAGLDAEFWADNALKQTAAYNSAKNDVFARVSGLSLDAITPGIQTPVVMAIAEQALYLLRNYAEQSTGQAVASESVDGLAVAYGVINKSDGILSPRALAYLDNIKTEMKRAAISGIRFNRG